MKKIFLAVVLCCVIAFQASAHSGRTDKNGGHWDNSTGTYHYHNNGSGDGGGCDAGFGAFALILAGGAAMALRGKK
jgi:hypothetical protein